MADSEGDHPARTCVLLQPASRASSAYVMHCHNLTYTTPCVRSTDQQDIPLRTHTSNEDSAEQRQSMHNNCSYGAEAQSDTTGCVIAANAGLPLDSCSSCPRKLHHMCQTRHNLSEEFEPLHGMAK
eukprot:3936062-Rhodomonas_salina.1